MKKLERNNFYWYSRSLNNQQIQNELNQEYADDLEFEIRKEN